MHERATSRIIQRQLPRLVGPLIGHTVPVIQMQRSDSYDRWARASDLPLDPKPTTSASSAHRAADTKSRSPHEPPVESWLSAGSTSRFLLHNESVRTEQFRVHERRCRGPEHCV